MVDLTVMALETPLVGVERSDVMLVVGLPDATPALMVRASAVEVPATVVVGGVVVDGTPGTPGTPETIMLTGG